MPERSLGDRLRADIVEYVEAHPDGVSRGVLRRDVTGSDAAILATVAELVAEGAVVPDESRSPVKIRPAGWVPPPPPPPPPDTSLLDCDRGPCYQLDGGRRVLCGTERCWLAVWGRAGRPVPIPGWEQAGHPSRRVWRARGGLFSFDVIDSDLFVGCDCGMANGELGEACGRASCLDCVTCWPVELCGVITARRRLCCRPASHRERHNATRTA